MWPRREVGWTQVEMIEEVRAVHKYPLAYSRVAVVGIGHELRGDDAAGVAVARRLQPLAHERLLVVEGGHAPENQTGAIRRFSPDLVLLVDAAQMNETPGTVRWLGWEESVGLSASTHTLPPSILAHYLVHEIGCEVVLVGIQPGQTALERPLSPEVQGAVDALVGALVQVFASSIQ